MAEPVTIDASTAGEPTLRAALTLSLATGRPFRLERFREEGAPPGLRPAHLGLLRAAGALCGQRLAPEVGATRLTFAPGEGPTPVRPGDYLLDAGAGLGVPALLMCLAPGLALAGGGSITARGATHLSDGPIFHALPFVWLPALRAYGFDADLWLRTPGFAPEGGGEVRAVIPAHSGEPPALVELPARGTLVEVHTTALVSGSALAHAEGLARGAELGLRERGIPSMTSTLPLPGTRAHGAAVLVRAHFEHTVATFDAVAVPGEPPEETGRRAAAGLGRLMTGPGALDAETALQLLQLAALLAAGRLGPSRTGVTRFQAPGLTPALRAVAQVAERLLGVRVALGEEGAVKVCPGAGR